MPYKLELKPLKIGKYTIPLPIFQGGMGVGISWDNLAGNVSKNGALGIISCVGTGYYKNSAFVQRVIKNRPFDTINFYSKESLLEIFKNARKICGENPLGANILYAINEYGRVVRDACEAGANMIITGAGLPTNMPEFTSNFPNVALIPPGVQVAICTDHPEIPIQHLTLCAALAARAGMDEEEALAAITINAACIAGVGDRLGSLTQGKDADLVVMDGHPFDWRSRVKHVLIDGQEVTEA